MFESGRRRPGFWPVVVAAEGRAYAENKVLCKVGPVSVAPLAGDRLPCAGRRNSAPRSVACKGRPGADFRLGAAKEACAFAHAFIKRALVHKICSRLRRAPLALGFGFWLRAAAGPNEQQEGRGDGESGAAVVVVESLAARARSAPPTTAGMDVGVTALAGHSARGDESEVAEAQLEDEASASSLMARATWPDARRGRRPGQRPRRAAGSASLARPGLGCRPRPARPWSRRPRGARSRSFRSWRRGGAKAERGPGRVEDLDELDDDQDDVESGGGLRARGTTHQEPPGREISDLDDP